MTLLFMDGFDHYAESGEQPLDKGYITGNFVYYDFVTGRFNYGYAIQFKDSMWYGYWQGFTCFYFLIWSDCWITCNLSTYAITLKLFVFFFFLFIFNSS